MDVDPVTVLKRKFDVLKRSFDFCIICQASRKDQLRVGSEDGKQKVRECVRRRRQFRDVASIDVLDRLDSLSDTEWASSEIKWHKNCYSLFTSEMHIQRLQKKAEESIVSETKVTEPASRSGRRSVAPVDWKKCMFCQTDKREELHNIEYMKKSVQIMEDAKFDTIMRVRLSGISDLPAAEGKYHLPCLVTFERKVEKIRKMGILPSQDLAMPELCNILEHGLALGHVYDMNSVWEKYQQLSDETPESEIPQKYLSRRQSFIDDVRTHLGHKANFVRSLDIKAPLFMYPGDKSDFVISKTLTKASKKELFASSDTDSSESSSEDDTVLMSGKRDVSLLQEMVHTAIKIRADLKNTPGHTDLWQGIDQEHVERIIPESLFLFLSLLFGGMDILEGSGDNPLEDSGAKRAICSIAQDIIYGVSNHRKLTPKHIGLGLALHQATRSENLVQLFHAGNHSIGINTVHRMDNAIANNVLDKYVANGYVYVPDNIDAERLVQYSCDNIDVLEATLDGKNTFHCTQMMAWQRSSDNHLTESLEQQTNRPAKLDHEVLARFHELDKAKLPSSGRPNPRFENGTEYEMDRWLSEKTQTCLSTYTNLAWTLARHLCSDDLKVPIWGAFNETRCSVNPLITTAGMLPILQAPADSNDTMATVINRFVSISRHLGQQYTVITADQPLYSRGKELVWANEENYRNVIFRMGGLHVCFNFLKAIGQHVESAGLDYVWIESGVFAPNTTETVLEGKAYYRAVRGHMLAYEALWRIRWRMFLDWLTTHQDKALGDLENIASPTVELFKLREKPARELFQTSVGNLEGYIPSQKLTDLLNEFDASMSTSKNYAFWLSYMKMVETLLNFIRAEREGNWQLHLESFAAILPWLVMYDHNNYSRWGPVYLTEMRSLEKTAPEIYREFQAGNFVIKRSQNLFNQVPPDQATEWINKMCKVSGGIIGITRSDQARDRFCATWAVRSHVSQVTKVLFGLLDDEEENTFARNDAMPSRVKLDEEKVKELVKQFVSLDVFGTSMKTQISESEASSEDQPVASRLVALATKDVAVDDISKDLLSAEEKGKLLVTEFTEQRLKEKNVGFFDTIKKQNSKTFATLYKIPATEKQSEKKLLKADRKLLQRLFNAASSGRSVQTADILKHELSPVPLSLAKPDGQMNQTSKSDMLSLLTTALEIETPSDIPKSELQTCVLIDGHATIQALGKPHGCNTFGDYADAFLTSVFKHLRHTTTRVDVTFDRYLGQQSIKSSTRTKRTAKRRPVRKLIQGPKVPLPQVWTQFIALEDNKADLATYLSEKLLQKAESLEGNCEVVAGGGFPDPVNTKSSKRDVTDLSANHEEADTRLILHGKDGIQNGYKRVIVICRDTDVLLLLLYHLGRTGAEIWMVSGTSKQKKCYPVHIIASKLNDDTLENILGFHAMTGCDTTSSFSGIGKKTCWKQYLETPKLLQSLGRDLNVQEVEEFVIRLYGGCVETEGVDIDLIRFNLFSKARKGLELLPPTKDALELHCFRADHQAKIWLNAYNAQMEIGTATDTGGWKLGRNGIEIVWSRLPAVPTACMELTTCGCKTKCSTARCECFKAGQICMIECACDAAGCANPVGLQAALEAIEYAESVQFPLADL